MIDSASLSSLMENLGAHRVSPWTPSTADDFARLEQSTGTLPQDFRQFLAAFGGVVLGHEDYNVIAPITEPCPWGSDVAPGTFYPLDAKHRYSIEKQLRTFKSRLPAGVLPLAHDAGGNLICLDATGGFPGSVWFWDHEQRWFRDHFSGSFENAAQELDDTGSIDARGLSVHDIIRGWARLHADRFDRPPDYMGMYKMTPTFADFLRSLHRVPY